MQYKQPCLRDTVSLRTMCKCPYKALQDEGGDQENIQIQVPFEASSKKGGKTKGNV